MSYVDRNLMAGETVIYRTRLHWIVFLVPLVVMVLVFWGGMAMLPGPGHRPEAEILIATALAMALVLVGQFMAYYAAEFAVTDKRVIVKVGVFRQRSLEILLTKIEAIGIDQPFLGRLFGFGTITIGGTGGTKEVFDRIRSPMAFRRSVQEQASAVH